MLLPKIVEFCKPKSKKSLLSAIVFLVALAVFGRELNVIYSESFAGKVSKPTLVVFFTSLGVALGSYIAYLYYQAKSSNTYNDVETLAQYGADLLEQKRLQRQGSPPTQQNSSQNQTPIDGPKSVI